MTADNVSPQDRAQSYAHLQSEQFRFILYYECRVSFFVKVFSRGFAWMRRMRRYPGGNPNIVVQTATSPQFWKCAGNSKTVTESALPANWQLSTASCIKQGGDATGSFDQANRRVGGITIESGKVTTCTFINTRLPGYLKVIKHVINDNGGSAVASDFTYTLGDGSSATSETGSNDNGGTKTASDFWFQVNGGSPVASVSPG